MHRWGISLSIKIRQIRWIRWGWINHWAKRMQQINSASNSYINYQLIQVCKATKQMYFKQDNSPRLVKTCLIFALCWISRKFLLLKRKMMMLPRFHPKCEGRPVYFQAAVKTTANPPRTSRICISRNLYLWFHKLGPIAVLRARLWKKRAAGKQS